MHKQTVDTSDRDTDVGDGKFRVGNQIDLVPNADAQKENDEKTVRTALRFFFSPEGQIFREFMLEEIVTVVDASSREAIIELSKSLGLTNLPAPSFARSIFKALSPELSPQDKQVWNVKCYFVFRLVLHESNFLSSFQNV